MEDEFRAYEAYHRMMRGEMFDETEYDSEMTEQELLDELDQLVVEEGGPTVEPTTIEDWDYVDDPEELLKELDAL